MLGIESPQLLIDKNAVHQAKSRVRSSLDTLQLENLQQSKEPSR